MDARARITPPDIVLILASLAILGGLIPVFVDVMAQQSAELSEGELLLLQFIVPGSILVLLAVIYRKAVVGA
jgi:hypothetical protein